MAWEFKSVNTKKKTIHPELVGQLVAVKHHETNHPEPNQLTVIKQVASVETNHLLHKKKI